MSHCNFRQSIQFASSAPLFHSPSLSVFPFLCIVVFLLSVRPRNSVFNFPDFSTRFFRYELKFSIEFSLPSLSVSLSLSLSVPCGAWRVDFWLTIFINLCDKCRFSFSLSLSLLVSVYMWNAPRRRMIIYGTVR